MRTVKAFLLAPLAPLAVIYLWTIAHFGMPHALIALIHPVAWLIALAIGLPALYVAELAFALRSTMCWGGRDGRSEDPTPSAELQSERPHAGYGRPSSGPGRCRCTAT